MISMTAKEWVLINIEMAVRRQEYYCGIMTWFLCTTKIVRQLLLKVREGFRGVKVVLDEYGMRRGKRAD